MKKKINLFIIAICLLFIPAIVNADETAVTLKCPETIKKSSNFTCSVYAGFTNDFRSLTTGFKSTSDFTFVSFKAESGVVHTGSGANIQITEYNNKITEGADCLLGTATFKASSSLKSNTAYYVSAVDGTLYYGENWSMKANGVKTAIRTLNNDVTLSNIEITDTGIDFVPTTYNYDLTTRTNLITITANAKDKNAKIAGTGVKQLEYGTNKFELLVTAEDGTTKKYTLNIRRIDERSTNNNLKSLTISSGNMEFNTNSSNYSITVDSSVTMFNLEGYVEDEKATFVTGFGPRTVNLVDGNNEILIKVKAENEDIKIYKINVYRKEKEETQTLTDIVLDDEETISVKEDVYQYKIVVDYNKKKIKLKTKHKGKPKIEIVGNEELEVGSNYFQIKVNSKETYNLEVVRNCMDCAILDTNNYLKDMSVEGHDFDFSRMSTTYSIPYNHESSLNITAMSENKDAYVQIIGNNNLKPGSIVKVLVTAEDGTTKEYQIKILEEASVKKENSDGQYNIVTVVVVAVISSLLTIILIGVGVLAFFKVKKKKKKKKNEKKTKDKEEKQSE